MIPIGHLLRVDQGRIQASSGVIPKLTSVKHSYKVVQNPDISARRKTINMHYITFFFDVKSASGSTYRSILKLHPDFNLSKVNSNPCQIYCSCNDFKYRSAYNLHQMDGLYHNLGIDAKLGAALTTAPKMKTQTSTLCKHAYAVVQHVMGNYQHLMSGV